jgi:selenocysteine lyase/cysteine desulfurase
MTGPAAAAHPGLAGGPAYLDYNATTPVDPRVTEAMLPHLAQFFGNPSSSHHYADAPRQALAVARARVAALIGARPCAARSSSPRRDQRPTNSPCAAPRWPPAAPART